MIEEYITTITFPSITEVVAIQNFQFCKDYAFRNIDISKLN